MRRLVLWCATGGLLAVCGCGTGSERVAVHAVSGTVVYAGEPAAGVAVYFYPTKAPTVPQIPMNPRAVTGPDGTFRLSTYGDGDGAAEGEYKVIFLWPKPTRENEESPPDKLFGWYDVTHTNLTAKVKPGENKLDPFKLPAVTGPPPVAKGIPGRN